jgi:surface antigen Omp85-like protein
MFHRKTTSVFTSTTVAMWFAVVGPQQASGQDTRAEEIAAKQREKAQQLAPYQPPQFERVMTRLEDNIASPPNGFFPVMGSVYSGGGFTLGPGYRRFFGRQAVFDIVGLYSIKNYKKIEVGTRTPWTNQGKVTLGARAGWFDAPQVGYYGEGMDLDQPRANYRLQQAYAAFTAGLRPNRWTRFHGEVAYEAYTTKEGHGSDPSIESIYTPETAPGLFEDPTYIRTEGLAAIDWRPAPGYARRGGFYGVTLASFVDLDETFSFNRLDGELIQHIPLVRETWVVSLRARVQTTLDDDDVVPYFLLPQLGSGKSLRGYPTGRIRDRHSLLTSAEFRWIPSRLALDMALFYDAGKVARDRSALDFNDLLTDWGFGARFHGPTTVVLRIEMAFGSEGYRLVFATSAAF